MTNHTTPTNTPLTDEERARKGRKRKAILASGAVLGVGAVVTLAAWNDTVFSNGTFGIGDIAWNVQGSHDGTDWAEYDTSPGRDIVFVVDGGGSPTALLPGQTAKGDFYLKETKGKLDAQITIEPKATAASALASTLLVTIKSEGATLVPSQPLSGTAGTTFTLPKGTQKKLEFEVTLPATASQSLDSNINVNKIWEMKAQSVGA
ncbi:SipW-dependent-type signal peptide-containing protein [Gordonia aurantiaca]|uniref:SipW-dependent-type signal peptide-containing protein n=1 Tax=Gordonia sp. B21 TaxID=3151852 RepID=UPI0032647047